MIDHKNQKCQRKLFLITLTLLFLLFSTCLSAQSAAPDARQRRVSLSAEEATAASLLTQLATLSGANIAVIDPHQDSDTAPKITISLNNVPMEHALNMIVRLAGLSYRFSGENTYLVGPRDRIREEIGERSYVIPLNNLNAERIAKSFASFGGSITPIEGQNAILVVANPETYSEIITRIQEIDIPQKQIEIRARLIEVSINDTEKIGIDWSRMNSFTTIFAENPVNGNNVGLPFLYNDDTGKMPHGDLWDFGKLPEAQYFQRIDGFNNVGHFSRQLMAYDVTLDLLLENNAAQLLTDTRVTSLNGQKAEIIVGEVIPFVVMDNDKQVQVEREETGIKLSVTPSINSAGHITIEVEPEVSSVTDLVGGYVPRTKVRRVNTTVTVLDGQKIHIGGLLHSNLITNTNKVPFLGSLPFIGRFFQHKYTYIQNTDLVIELTPRVINLAEEQYDFEIDSRLGRELIKKKTDEENKDENDIKGVRKSPEKTEKKSDEPIGGTDE